MKNKIIVITLILSAFLTQSCQEWLSEDLTGTDVVSGEYFKTPAGFEDGIEGIYGQLKNIWGQEMGFTTRVFGTDIHTEGADGGHKRINRYEQDIQEDSYWRNSWRDYYRIINQCNAMIGRAEEVVGMDPGILKVRVAEARFLRGWIYFTIARTWDGGHLTLEETIGVETKANWTPASEIYSQAIIPDLEAAAADLPKPGDESDYGRANQAAAKFMLGKVYATLGQYGGSTDAGALQKAADYMDDVINNYGLSLVNDWGSLWDITKQKNSESVWTLQNTTDYNINGNGHRGHLYFLMEYDKLPGMIRDVNNGRPWKRFKPTPFLLGLWDRTVDSRYDLSYKHVWYVNHDDPSKIPAGLLYGDTAVYIPGPNPGAPVEFGGKGSDAEWDQPRQGTVPYMVITADEYTRKLYPTMNKWIDTSRDHKQRTEGQRDYIVARLADAYLIAAEAYVAMGQPGKALPYVNAIRTRAAWPGMEAAMQVTAADLDIDYILDERARELNGEAHRWFDLVRTNKLIERVKLHNADAQDNIQDYHVRRPIHAEQIDAVEGGYHQNPGYVQ
ncbi:MAG: RagB/SusD family nutrient uptake outer membrane protein [Cyclobacteriaceae bacterium]|nr:RagB/SusD family nutrient uptake outer membrane protein [Cyclobacteriaceae bacterium]